MDNQVKAIQITTHIALLTHLPGMHYMFIPAHVVQHFGGGFKRRLIATVNDGLQWQCGLMSLRDGNAYISISKDKMKQAKIENGSTISLRLELDNSKYGLPVPEEFKIVIDQDPEAQRRFERLSAGMQRYILAYVAGVKTQTNALIEQYYLCAIWYSKKREMKVLEKCLDCLEIANPRKVNFKN